MASEKFPTHNRAAAKASLGAVSRHGTAKQKAAVRGTVKQLYPAMGQRNGRGRGKPKAGG